MLVWREANKLACDYCRGRVEGDVTELASTRSLYIRAEATGASRGTISGWGFGVGGGCDGDAATATAFGRLLGGGKTKSHQWHILFHPLLLPLADRSNLLATATTISILSYIHFYLFLYFFSFFTIFRVNFY